MRKLEERLWISDCCRFIWGGTLWCILHPNWTSLFWSVYSLLLSPFHVLFGAPLIGHFVGWVLGTREHRHLILRVNVAPRVMWPLIVLSQACYHRSG